MFRLILLMMLFVALTGASSMSVVHGLPHDQSHAQGLGKVVDVDHQMHTDAALADCCEAPGGAASGACLVDQVASTELCLVALARATRIFAFEKAKVGGGFMHAVPTGPPKV